MRSISGSLASSEILSQLAHGETQVAGLRAVLGRARQAIGPATPPRTIFDRQVLPLLREVGLAVCLQNAGSNEIVGTFGHEKGGPAGTLAVAAWGGDLRRLRERSARAGGRWWLGANGTTLRLMDGTRAFARRVLDFDLQRLEDEDEGLAVLRALLTCENGGLATLASTLARSDAFRVSVGRSLQAGVERALDRLVEAFASRSRRAPTDAAFGEALTVVYRILFLLFAEARGLVPRWHPVYRDSYTIEALRPVAESRRPPAGLWQSLQAISRLAHRGCNAGTLRVVPFNGRLFAPASAPLADSRRVDDRVARDVLLAVTTRPGADRLERISYADLGVEQLGAVYERVLDYVPGGERRRTTGTFYTPRALTEYLVRRTLAPLVEHRTPDQVLALRVLDPAMGSGAFLVAACRYLAEAYEAALVAEGATDITIADRAMFRRLVAQRCLYGVDVNPTAVQLARLSLWLCTLAADRPLTFLDHHLRSGNSLIGARVGDVARQPPGGSRGRAAGVLPLFDDELLTTAAAETAGRREALARAPDDSAADVRAKERTIDELAGPRAPLAGWRAVADAWCAAWFWNGDGPAPDARAWPAFAAALRGAAGELPAHLARQWRETAARVASEQRFFHWELEFPEVFFDPDGKPAGNGGFDAVIGNPPWAAAHAIAPFARQSGCYRLQDGGHANLYQVFAERMLQLTAPGGRVGMLMPWGLLADLGCASLRRRLFERWNIDVVLGFDNRDALFPIHRGLRFALMTMTEGSPTPGLRTRFGLRTAAALEEMPDRGDVPQSVTLPMTLLERFSGSDVAVPEITGERDRAILARVLAAIPPLGSPRGWNARFGREFNATDDRRHFGPEGLPVLEGKHLEPFVAHTAKTSRFMAPAVAAARAGARIPYARARVGYREVASSTNRLTLIAAVVPAGVVTTHTVFCLRRPFDAEGDELQWYLCGMFNSFTANYLVRLRAGTHVPAATIHRLPVPVVDRGTAEWDRFVAVARAAARDPAARAELHARSARAYGLDADDFAHVLSSFPLVDAAERAAALTAMNTLTDAV